MDELQKLDNASKAAVTGTASTSANAATAGSAATGATTTGSATDASTSTADATTSSASLSSAYTDTPWAQQVNAMYDAQKEAQLSRLENAYQQNMSGYQEQLDALAPSYQNKANDLAVQYERNRRNFNQQAIGNGINTGAASQAALAQNSVYLRDYGKLRTSQAEAEANINRDIAQLGVAYQNQISEALAENAFDRAGALMDEYNNAYARAQAEAELRAGYGDFSGYVPLFGQDVANAMKYNWAAQNPDIAYWSGAITEAQRNNLAEGLPINQNLDENGNYLEGYGPSTDGGGGSSGDSGSWYLNRYNLALSKGLTSKAVAEQSEATANTFYNLFNTV